MSIVLGIDIGSSSVKIVNYEGDIFAGAEQFLYGETVKAAEDALHCFLEKYHMRVESISFIAATGVGAIELEDSMLGIPVIKVDEFAAIARGGLTLAGVQEAVVVSMGTGTAFIRVDGQGFRHVGGSGVGGGTLTGICRHFFGLHSSESVKESAGQGDLTRVDLQIRDLIQDEDYPLPPDVTSSNFGKITANATQNDLVLGFINMIFQSIGIMAALYCSNDSIKTAVLIGSLTELPQAAEYFEAVQNLYDVKFVIPPKAQYATAIGAVAEARDGYEA